MTAMDDFASRLLIERGVTTTGPVRDEMHAELVERASDFLNRRLVDAMSEPVLARFTELVEGEPSAEAVQTFIARNVPNPERVAASALVEFRNIYLGR
jgi:hypothetical protein